MSRSKNLIRHCRCPVKSGSMGSGDDFPNTEDLTKICRAARYAKSLKLDVIHLIMFVEHISDENRQQYETDYTDEETGGRVVPVFVATGK